MKNSPLHNAIQDGNLEEFKLLLEHHGCDLKARDKHGRSPLLAVAAAPNDTNDHCTMARLLLEKGLDLEERDDEGMTTLLLAVSRGKFDLMKYLIEIGADASIVDNYGRTTLQQAITFDRSRILRYLMNENLDLNATDKRGFGYIHHALHSCKDVSMCTTLLRNGLVPCEINYDSSCSPLYMVQSFLHMSYYDIHESDPFSLAMEEVLEGVLTMTANINVFLKHVAILSSQNIPIGEKNVNIIENDRSMKNYYTKCMRKLEELKLVKVHNDFTLFDILAGKMSKIRRWTSNDEFIAAFNAMSNIEQRYPMYADWIRDTFELELKRQMWFESAATFLSDVIGLGDRFQVVNRVILSYMTDAELIRIGHRVRDD